jgi:drug/metabolite transporter (DMT)-like permease
MTAWLLVFLIVGATTAADLLQSSAMKQHGEIHDLNRSLWASLARKRALIGSVFFMAVSFFSFAALLSIADLSFAVPATALSIVVETVLARWALHEKVEAQRWTGAVLVACGVALLGA